MIVAIDGPAAAGKGTLARALAKAFGLAYLDTGALYRATALRVLRASVDPTDAAAAAQAAEITPQDLADPHLRHEATGEMASRISAIPEVRASLLAFQRKFAAEPPENTAGAVLDGRDIGTVVCPDAAYKIFVTASDEVRAHRRWLELSATGEAVNEADVLADMRKRDARDAERATAPMKPADDAYLLDTSNLDIDASFECAEAYISGA
jgi:cytidylate kinase